MYRGRFYLRLLQFALVTAVLGIIAFTVLTQRS